MDSYRQVSLLTAPSLNVYLKRNVITKSYEDFDKNKTPTNMSFVNYIVGRIRIDR